MTKSTITREESVQAVFDLKVGYRLGFADLEILKRVARMALAAMDSEPGCLPLDYLQGHKDGLEWAAQLAEANHPETGDWLYDDPIELAKAIRKGPDMPPAQPVADSEPDRNPVLAYADSYRDMAKQGVESVPIWSVITDLERNIAPLYRHAQQPVVPATLPCSVELKPGLIIGKGCKTETLLTALRRRADYNADIDAMTPEERAKHDASIKAFKAMLAAAPQLPGSEPATVPGKWIPVSERMPETDGNYWGWWSESKRQGPVWFIKSELQAQFQSSEITHWMPLPDAPQEVKGE